MVIWEKVVFRRIVYLWKREILKYWKIEKGRIFGDVIFIVRFEFLDFYKFFDVDGYCNIVDGMDIYKGSVMNIVCLYIFYIFFV